MPWATRHATVTGQTHSNTKRQRLFATEGTENGNGGDFVTATATATATAFATEGTENGKSGDFVTATATAYGLRRDHRERQKVSSFPTVLCTTNVQDIEFVLHFLNGRWGFGCSQRPR